ncbi:retinal pigment epithelial membrane family protein [Mycobacterium ulcerans str. Harvey]|uniref:Dioxygenase n=1 Tax=Mycobacterium ulcerans str. Harvey TaxID=1299332 RepID=A0ABP3AQQ4_MYCUL|nr:retinal pigment epithelial membrane family protein [Mycobacterium ulcerans str. Harvey]
MSYSFTRGHMVQYSVIDTQGRARRTVDIEVTGSPMMHDFSLTDKYVVIYDLPVTFDSAQVMPVKMPSWLGVPARLVMASLIGNVRVPSLIAAMLNRNPKPSNRLPYAWNPPTRPGSGSCPGRVVTGMSDGLISSPATSTTRSTRIRSTAMGPRC